jgi:hypothetical protein
VIKLFITGQKLVVETPLIVTDTIDYLEAQATFRTKDWDNAIKWLHLSNGIDDYNQLFDNDIITKEKHLNLTTGEWTLFVHGTIGNTRITTNEVTITVESTGTLGGQPLPDIPISESEQIMQTAKNAVNIANSVREDADNGNFNGLTPHVGDNGNWFIGDNDTGVLARGTNGETPYIKDGYWWIGETNTGVLAQGTNYILTELDKQEIADIILLNFVDVSEVGQ